MRTCCWVRRMERTLWERDDASFIFVSATCTQASSKFIR